MKFCVRYLISNYTFYNNKFSELNFNLRIYSLPVLKIFRNICTSLYLIYHLLFLPEKRPFFPTSLSPSYPPYCQVTGCAIKCEHKEECLSTVINTKLNNFFKLLLKFSPRWLQQIKLVLLSVHSNPSL